MAKKLTAKNWPDLCKLIRAEFRITQREAAERLGTVVRSWQNWEYGRSCPNKYAARLIADEFGATIRK